jgi:hypothetical protein
MKMAKLFLSFTLVAVIFFTGCEKANNVKDFYGKWESRRGSGNTDILIVDISAESWKGQYSGGSANSYTIEGLTWVTVVNNDPVTKNEYPKGYYMSGTATQVNNIDGISVGIQITFELYMSKDKTKFYRKQNNNPIGGADYIFTKIVE